MQVRVIKDNFLGYGEIVGVYRHQSKPEGKLTFASVDWVEQWEGLISSTTLTARAARALHKDAPRHANSVVEPNWAGDINLANLFFPLSRERGA